MGSVNPVVVTAGALAARGAQVAAGFVDSMTLGSGQFCTKPGLVLLPDSADGRAFEEAVAVAVAGRAAGVLLNAGIAEHLRGQLAATAAAPGVRVLAAGSDRPPAAAPATHAVPTVLVTDAATFLASPGLAEEHFGPVAVLVRCADLDAESAVTAVLPGSLTATFHAEEQEAPALARLLDRAGELAGRVIRNQFPTGVAVAPAMHHGGPWPATTFPAHTSVDTAAVRRFLRPVLFQGFPDALLPAPLRDTASP